MIITLNYYIIENEISLCNYDDKIILMKKNYKIKNNYIKVHQNNILYNKKNNK